LPDSDLRVGQARRRGATGRNSGQACPRHSRSPLSEATIATNGALTLELKVRTGIVLEEVGDDSGRHSLLPVTRQVTHSLVPGDGADEWLVERWAATLRTGDVRIVTSG